MVHLYTQIQYVFQIFIGPTCRQRLHPRRRDPFVVIFGGEKDSMLCATCFSCWARHSGAFEWIIYLPNLACLLVRIFSLSIRYTVYYTVYTVPLYCTGPQQLDLVKDWTAETQRPSMQPGIQRPRTRPALLIVTLGHAATACLGCSETVRVQDFFVKNAIFGDDDPYRHKTQQISCTWSVRVSVQNFAVV